MPTDPGGALSLHISRPFTLIYVALGLVMDALSVFDIAVAGPSMGTLAAVVGWISLFFFGIITLLVLIQFIWSTRFGLTLDAEGFTVTTNLGWRRYRWAQVERFFPYHTVALSPVVAFKYRGKAEVHGLQWTRGMFNSFDGSLPQNLPVRGRALLELMETWRLHMSGRNAGPPTFQPGPTP
jgi:hypothetical protein